MTTSQDILGPLGDEMSQLNSTELMNMLQTFSGGFGESSESATSTDLSRLLHAADVTAAQAGAANSQPLMEVSQPQLSAQIITNNPLSSSQSSTHRARGGNSKLSGGNGGAASSATSLLSQAQQQNGPYVEIIEQPRTKGLRFRYECEGRSAGSIPGEKSTADKKTFPAIKIYNHSGAAVVVVSCVTKDQPKPKPHPHALVGKDCTKGVCTVKVRDTSVVTFPHLGIQCAKKKEVEDALKLRQSINVDPFQTGFGHIKDNIDLNIVKLCFQVFLPDTNGKFTRILQPVCSLAILDKKAHNELVICRIDHTSGRARGGDEVFLLCEKVNKDDITVNFYETNQPNQPNADMIWQAYGNFGQGDVHRQLAIVFKTPSYKEPNLRSPRQVWMQLKRPSDQETSESICFTYMPEDPDPHQIEEKRKRKCQQFDTLLKETPVMPAHALVKERLKAKATRKIKQEQVDNILPTYSLSNIGGKGGSGIGNESYMRGKAGGTTATTTLNYSSMAHTSLGNVQVNSQPASRMANPIMYEHMIKNSSSPEMVQQTATTQAIPMGTSPGFQTTNAQGLQMGSSHGFQTATTQGLQMGSSPGFQTATTQGIPMGSSSGFQTATTQGIQMGSSPGFQTATTQGIQTGAGLGSSANSNLIPLPGGQYLDASSDLNFASTGSEDVVISDINLGDQPSSFDLAVLQAYLRDGQITGEPAETPVTSYGLSGDLMTIDYDPNVAAMESVSSDMMEPDTETQRQCDEVHQALAHLNQ